VYHTTVQTLIQLAGALQVGSFWKTNPPGRGFSGFFGQSGFGLPRNSDDKSSNPYLDPSPPRGEEIVRNCGRIATGVHPVQIRTDLGWVGVRIRLQAGGFG